jgi:hypothetical protein
MLINKMFSPKKNKFWLENIASLFYDFSVVPLEGMKIAEQMNAITRLIFIVFVILFLLNYQHAILFLLISIVFIIILYYIQRRQMEQFKYCETEQLEGISTYKPAIMSHKLRTKTVDNSMRNFNDPDEYNIGYDFSYNFKVGDKCRFRSLIDNNWGIHTILRINDDDTFYIQHKNGQIQNRVRRTDIKRYIEPISFNPHEKNDYNNCTKGSSGKIWRKNRKEFDQWEQGKYGPIEIGDSVMASHKDKNNGVNNPAVVTDISNDGKFIKVQYHGDGFTDIIPFSANFVRHNVSPDVPISSQERSDEGAFTRGKHSSIYSESYGCKYSLDNGKLSGPANPKTKLKPTIKPRITDLRYWQPNESIKHSAIVKERSRINLNIRDDIYDQCSKGDNCSKIDNIHNYNNRNHIRNYNKNSNFLSDNKNLFTQNQIDIPYLKSENDNNAEILLRVLPQHENQTINTPYFKNNNLHQQFYKYRKTYEKSIKNQLRK